MPRIQRRSLAFRVGRGVLRILSGLALCLPLTSCIEYLGEGQIGQARFIYRARGETPLPIAAPTNDRDGNMYFIYALDAANIEAGVVFKDGGASGGCYIHEGADRRTHGFVGWAQSRAWFWSGDALGVLSGNNGDCRELLDRDPTTGVDIKFKAVVPYVKETPSQTTLVALVQSPVDRVPYNVQIDLDLRRYSSVEEFEPPSAREFWALGTGADRDAEIGVVVLRYEINDDIRTEARYYDTEANEIDIVSLGGMGLGNLEEDAVLGFVEGDANGFMAAALSTGEVLIFNRNGGDVVEAPGIDELVGVHRWQGATYVVGVRDGRPATSRLGANGQLEQARVWRASEAIANTLDDGIEVLDDTVRPIRFSTWTNARSATGIAPYLHPQSPPPYANETTVLLIAGPTSTAALDSITSVAVAPAGISYP